MATLADADDLVDADGQEVLSYAQAVKRASAWDPDAVNQRAALATVGDVCRDYLEWAERNRGRSAREMRYALDAHLFSDPLAEVSIDRLKSDHIRRWHADLASKPARIRSRHGEQRYRAPQSEEEHRARRATANRILSMLKAALNRAWKDERIECSDVAWRRVSPFKGVQRSRTRYLQRDEIRRLLNSIDEPDFRGLVSAAIYTGARYQELARLRVEDVDLDASAVRIHRSKNGRSRSVFVNAEGVTFLESLVAGRSPSDRVFTRGGVPWGKSEQQHRLRRACEIARIEPPITFHGLRHTYASLYLMAGGGLQDLARQLGHTTTRMVELHYGHLADHWRAERAEQYAPTLELAPQAVRRLAAAERP